ncbi:hypothetical protein ABW19_dt0202354 [Dactylella cylindrospora]|nr:hypothetical protein ABW19_dt0202354 [Dactylella cylindrospora]
MASIESITSTIGRYLSQYDENGQFRAQIQHFKEKLNELTPSREHAVELRKVIDSRVFHQFFRMIQRSKTKKRKLHANFDGISEDDLLAQSLDKFQDLFEMQRLKASRDQKGEDGNDEIESSDFEDLFGEGVGEDDYSEFEDLEEEVNAMRLQEKASNPMPDSQDGTPYATAPECQPHQVADFDMASEDSTSDYVILEDTFMTNLPSADINQEYQDDALSDFFENETSPKPSKAASLGPKRLHPGIYTIAQNASSTYCDEEESMMF